MDGESSLAGLLQLLLDLPDGTPIIATPSFADWVTAGNDTVMQSFDAPGTSPRLVLIDTRDRAGRRLLHRIRSDGQDRTAAALVLSGCGPPGSPARRLLRRLRRPGMRRMPEARVLETLHGSALRKIRLAFNDTFEVPADFVVDSARRSTGAAFLLTRGEPFDGPIWELIRRRMSPALEVRRLQLRERGAAIVMVRDGQREYVLRIVAPGRLQDVVLRNAALLAGVRAAVASRTDLLGLLPEPVFNEFVDGVAVLAETCLPGVLAWTVARGSRARQIRGGSVAFLDALRNATLTGPTNNADALIRPDLERIRDAGFLADASRRRIQAVLERAAVTLSRTIFRPCTSHGDFGYGNILVDPASGGLTGIIDWDTARAVDFPGIDRVNLELQIARSGSSFPEAVRNVWTTRSAHDALLLDGDADHQPGSWALFTLAVCRYITRALSYPAVYSQESSGFEGAVSWLEANTRQVV